MTLYAKHHTGAIFRVEARGDDGVVTLLTNSKGKKFEEYRNKILMFSDDPAWFMNNYVGEVKPGVPVLNIVQCVLEEHEEPLPNWSHSNGLQGPESVKIVKGNLFTSKVYGQVYWTKNDAVVLSADRLFPIFPNRFYGLEVGEVRKDYVLRLLDGTLQFTSLDLLHRFGRVGERYIYVYKQRFVAEVKALSSSSEPFKGTGAPSWRGTTDEIERVEDATEAIKQRYIENAASNKNFTVDFISVPSEVTVP